MTTSLGGVDDDEEDDSVWRPSGLYTISCHMHLMSQLSRFPSYCGDSIINDTCRYFMNSDMYVRYQSK